MPNRILASPAFQQQQQQPPRPNNNNGGSMIELLARVPMNRGSLLKSIDNLLKTIETSENAVMIPTLLKDKVRVDAWELLLVAKILKASILGHGDLVEFYLNHIGHSSASLSSTVAQQQQQNGNSTVDFQLVSPPVARAQFQQSPMGSPLAQTPTIDRRPILSTASSCSTSSSVHSASSSTTLNNSKSSSSSVSWMTANNQQANLSSSGASFSSVLSSSTDVNTTTIDESVPEDPPTPTPTPASNGASSQADASAEANRTLLAATSSARQAQPPSLLQLTTTNNHINSMMADMFNQSGQLLSPSLDQLTTQFATFQQHQNGNSPTGSNLAVQFEAGALSISTSSPPAAAATATPTHLDLPPSSAATPTAATPPPTRELRSSRSAGCLFRGANQSGASSPRAPHASAAGTPTTPASVGYPQAETLAQVGANGLVGDPSTLVKLLLQVEQLKSSIKHATVLLESVVELYKKSIDNIA